MTRTIMVTVVIALAVAGVARASPPTLVRQATDRFSIELPKGWKVTVQNGTTTVVTARQDPARKDAAVLLLDVRVIGNTSSTDLLLDTTAAKLVTGIKVTKREALEGGKLLVADAMVGSTKVRITEIAYVGGGAGAVFALVAKPAEHDDLGGVELIKRVMASMKLVDTPTTPSPPPTKRQYRRDGSARRAKAPRFTPDRPHSVALHVDRRGALVASTEV